MRIYIWTNNSNYNWGIDTNTLWVGNIYQSVTLYTNMEFHFYTEGHCGDDKYEKSFKGIIRMCDIDMLEGVMVYSGYNRFFMEEGIPIISVLPGESNSTNSYNPFSKTGTAEYPYFFGTRQYHLVDNIWIEINSTLDSPFMICYAAGNYGLGMLTYYTGTPIEYYIDGELKDIFYCVPYGTYKLISPSKMDNMQEDIR